MTQNQTLKQISDQKKELEAKISKMVTDFSKQYDVALNISVDCDYIFQGVAYGEKQYIYNAKIDIKL